MVSSAFSKVIHVKTLIFTDFMTMMLETDVQIKWDNDVKKTNGTAVIASKPNTEHDITLSDWLTIVENSPTKALS